MDQEVSLGGPGPGTRKILLNNGPSVSVESADWLASDVFLLTQVTTDERQKQWSPEIYLFSLKDSTFTNFTWTRKIPQDSLSGLGEFKDIMLSRGIRKATQKTGRNE